MSIITICNRIIEYSFYALFFFVPLVFASDTSELFELNKIWLTFGITLIIAAAWGVKMIRQRRISIQKTPIDIPILLFLLSQIISTIFSLDTHTSLWGYYSRFNGGLLSLVAYLFLYYAFVSNFTKDIANKSLLVSLAAGAVVTLWGLPSHFGFDPTCYLFRGSFDVSCWTDAFQPKVRIFSTLGQPNWLAAYLSILMPIAIALGLTNHKSQITNHKQNTNIQTSKRFEYWNLSFDKLRTLSLPNGFGIWNLEFGAYLLLATLFYLAVLFTGSRSGFLGLLAGGAVFFLLSNKKLTFFKFVILPLFVLSLLIGTPIDQQIKQFSTKFLPKSFSAISNKPQAVSQPQGPALETGGTESGTIRLIVWKGALDIWLHNPLFGTGVETFAFAYYKYRPIAHNLTSEWDYLYNKAHNEYLNYLATTGIFGLGSYLLMIGSFLFITLKNHKSQITNHKQNTNIQTSKRFEYWNLSFDKLRTLSLPNGFGIWNLEFGILELALLASYVSILVSNFLGFSVVIINLYLFLIPAFVFVLGGMIDPQKAFLLSLQEIRDKQKEIRIPITQWAAMFSLLLIACYLLLMLFRFWQADKSYALGQNLDHAGEYQNAYLSLSDAVGTWPSQPVFGDEFSYNNAVLAVILAGSPREAGQKDASQSAKLDQAKIASYSARLAKQAILLSNKIVTDHPNNIVFWKTRVRLFYMLSQLDPVYLTLALDAIQHAQKLAPTDAKVSYSLSILYGQNDESKKAIETLQETIRLKPDYKEAYYALGLFYHNLAIDKNNRVVDQALQEKAKNAMQYILDHFSSSDAQAKKAIETWEKP